MNASSFGMEVIRVIDASSIGSKLGAEASTHPQARKFGAVAACQLMGGLFVLWVSPLSGLPFKKSFKESFHKGVKL